MKFDISDEQAAFQAAVSVLAETGQAPKVKAHAGAA